MIGTKLLHSAINSNIMNDSMMEYLWLVCLGCIYHKATYTGSEKFGLVTRMMSGTYNSWFHNFFRLY